MKLQIKRFCYLKNKCIFNCMKKISNAKVLNYTIMFNFIKTSICDSMWYVFSNEEFEVSAIE